MTTLENFEGFVDQIRDGIAYFTLKSEHGDSLWCQCDAVDLLAKGIQKRFHCRTVEQDGLVRVEMEAIPDRILTEEEEKEIHRQIAEKLGD